MKTESSQNEQTTEMTEEMYEYETETSTQEGNFITASTAERAKTITREDGYETSSVNNTT